MMINRIQFGVVLTSILVSSTAFATIWTVDDDGKADFDNIQDAIDAASNGDEIVVNPGTYIGSGNNVIEMNGKAVWLHSAKGQNITYIDGQGKRRGILCDSGETNTTVIEGFTIQNCNALWHDWDGDNTVDSWEKAGGGMGNGMSHPSVIDCHFSNNNGRRGGGGVFNYQSNPTISFCTFSENSVDQDGSGAGMLNRDGSSPVLNGCSFLVNDAGNIGGGMYNYDSSSPTLSECVFSSNSAGYFGGGMYNRFFSEPTLVDCLFSGNSAVHGGGGMFNSSLSNTTLTGCDFFQNYTTDVASVGGGIGNSNSSPNLSNCSFSYNSAQYSGGGIYCTVGSQATIILCNFNGNQAEQNGGGAYFDFFSDSTIEDSTIVSNTAGNDGGGIYVLDYCAITMTNTDVELNNATNGGGISCSVQSELALTGCTIDTNTAPTNTDVLARQATQVLLSGTNSAGEVSLADVGTALQLATGSVFNMNGSLNLSPQGGLGFDIHNLNSSAPLTIDGTLAKNGSLGVTNDSGSLATATIGEIVPLIQASSVGQSLFSSIVLPAMPEGLGLQVTETSQPDQGTEIAIEVIQDDGAQFEDPLFAGLNSTPVDLIALDIEGDGKDEIAVLYGGSPGTIAVFAVSGDGSPPSLIQGLTVNVGNNPVDCDGKDLNGDGMDDIVVANATDSTLTVLTTTVGLQNLHEFTSKTVPISGSDQKPSCVAIVDWNSNINPSGDVVVGMDKIDEAENDTFQVLLDVASDESNGPTFPIPKYEYAGTEFADAPTGVDGFKGGTVLGIERGFVGGTKYGNIYKGTITGARGSIVIIGQLDGRNISSLDVTDLDDGGGDGKSDVLVGSDEAGMIYIIPGDDSRANGFGDLIPIDIDVEINDIFASDVDGDGDKDFVVTAPGSASPFFVLRNGGASNLMPGGLGNRAWNKQDIPSSNTPDKVAGGELDDRDEDDDWMMGSGSGSGLLGGEPGSMEQTNIIFGGGDCLGDLNVDGIVNVNDLLILIAAWGTCDGCDADLNADGNVNINDLLVLIAAWGPCTP